MIDKVVLKENIEKSLAFRKEGLTYKDIAEKMNRPVATIKRWLAPYKEKASEAQKKSSEKGRLKMMENFALKRKLAYDTAMKEAEVNLKDNVLLRDFVNMYIGEGSKRVKTEVFIINSDPNIIYLSVSMLKRFFLQSGKSIKLQIRYYKENNNEIELLNYWKNLLKNDSCIEFTTYEQPTVKAKGHNNSNKFGLVSVKINDSYAKEKMNAYIDYVKSSWIKDFESSFNTTVDKSIVEIKKTVIV